MGSTLKSFPTGNGLGLILFATPRILSTSVWHSATVSSRSVRARSNGGCSPAGERHFVSELSSEAYDNLFFANGYFYAHVLMVVPPIGNARPTEVGWAAGFTSAHPFPQHSNDIMNSRIAYGDGVYIQVSYVTLSSASVYRSTDGQNWSAINIASTCPTA